MSRVNVVNSIIEFFQLSGPEDIEFEKMEDEEDLYTITHENRDYILFVSTTTNDLIVLQKYIDISVNTSYILMYKDLYSLKSDQLKCKNPSILTLMKSAFHIFTDASICELNVGSRGENYLEYSNKNDIEALVYTVKLKDVHDLYKSNGDNLFKQNVRIGINKSVKEKAELIDSFKRSFIMTLHKKIEYVDDVIIKNEIYEGVNTWSTSSLAFDLDSLSRYNDKLLSDSFWLKHNGITIVNTENDGFNIKENKICIDVKKVQVINGAQTISTWSEIFYEIDMLFKRSDDNETGYKWVKKAKDIIHETANDMTVKLITINIKADDTEDFENYVSEITVGLNTQVPVNVSDVFMKKNEEFKKLNDLVYEKYNISIVKAGELIDYMSTFSLKDIVQLYLVATGQPGNARNLRKETITDIEMMNSITQYLDGAASTSFVEFIRVSNVIDKWWRTRTITNKKAIDEVLLLKFDTSDFKEPFKTLSANGLYLFKAYIYNTDENRDWTLFKFNIEEELNLLYVNFVETFKSNVFNCKELVEQDISYNSNLFKGNDSIVYKNLMNREHLATDSSTIQELDIADLENAYAKYISENGATKIKSNNYVFLYNYLKSKNIKINNPRTVSLTKTKVTESFHFPNEAFNEIADYFNNGTSETEKLDFYQSAFHKMLQEEYNIFVFDDNKIVRYKFYFNCFLEEAKQVFNSVIKGFSEGNSDLFLKQSDNMKFHVRPKAINSSDVIRLYEDEYITKQTFWFNRADLDLLVKSEFNVVNYKAQSQLASKK